MKRLALAFFGIALLLSNLAAHAASATFATRNGAIFQLFLNGHSVNGPGSSEVRIDRLPAGPYNLEFRVPGRRGKMVFNTRVMLQRGFETNYILVLPGYSPNFMLKKVSVVPLRSLATPHCPPSHPSRPHDHGAYDDYDGYDDYDNYHEPGNNYQPQPSNLMTRYDVDLLAESMHRKSFESSKLEIARQALERNTILAEDVKYLMGLFSFESSRLEFAKFAYSRLADSQNFYRVYDAFEFESSIREMQRWLK